MDIRNIKQELSLSVRNRYVEDTKSTIKSLSSEYSIPINTIKGIIKKYKINRGVQKYSNKLKKEIVSRYVSEDKATTYSLGKEYGIRHSVISKFIKKYGANVDKRIKSYFNENYFDKINSEEKAYWLGLIYADGNNHENHTFSIGLKEEDGYLIELLKKHIEFTGKLLFKPINKKNKNWSNQIRITLISRSFCNNLSKLGCTPRKSLTLEFPTNEIVPDNLMRHFIRGYFDGDGSVSISKDKKLITCSFTSSVYFCNNLRKFIHKEFGFTSKVQVNKNRNPLTAQYPIAQRRAIIFLNYIYKNSTIRMTRKFNKFIEFISRFTPKRYTSSKISNQTILNIKNHWGDFSNAAIHI